MMIGADSGGGRWWRALLAPREGGRAAIPCEAARQEAAALPESAGTAPADPAAIALGTALIAQLPAWRRLHALY
jgi:hypothetical protein